MPNSDVANVNPQLVRGTQAPGADGVSTITQTNPQLERTLGGIVEYVDQFDAVYKQQLQFGDCVQVRTLNSTYSIQVLGDDLYSVSGGWFDHEGLSPFKTTVNGCTWGGRAIKIDVVAACGLHLEFGNQLITTRIQKVDVVRYEGVQRVH